MEDSYLEDLPYENKIFLIVMLSIMVLIFIGYMIILCEKSQTFENDIESNDSENESIYSDL